MINNSSISDYIFIIPKLVHTISEIIQRNYFGVKISYLNILISFSTWSVYLLIVVNVVVSLLYIIIFC